MFLEQYAVHVFGSQKKNNMIIKNEFPPNYAAIVDKFPFVKKLKTVVFCYGDVLYNPYNGPIQEHLLVHERTHTKQQGNDIEGWWNKYLNDSAFRFQQELEAYRNQYEYFASHNDRDTRRWFLKMIATDLSSAMYGNIVDFNKAKELIQNK